MKRLFGLLICIGLCFGLFATAGCGGIDLYIYMYAGEYAPISAEEQLENVKDIDIDWLAGSVKITTADVEKVIITESGAESAKYPAYYRLQANGFLTIKFLKSGETRKDDIEKNLIITLPKTIDLQGVDVDAATADVTIDKVECDSLALSHLKGNSWVKNSTFSNAKIETNSGNTVVDNCTVVYKLTLNPYQGTVQVSSSDIMDYAIITYKGEITLVLNEDSFSLDLEEGSKCEHEDFELTEGERGLLIYGDEDNILHKITFGATHREGLLNLVKSVV